MIISYRQHKRLNKYNMNQSNSKIKQVQIRQTDIVRGTEFNALIKSANSLVKDVTIDNIQQSFILPKQSVHYNKQPISNGNQPQTQPATHNQSQNYMNSSLRVKEDERQSQLLDQVKQLQCQNTDKGNLSLVPDHFTVSRVEKVKKQNEEYQSVKSDNFPLNQIFYIPFEIELPLQKANKLQPEQQVLGIIPCIFESIVKQKRIQKKQQQTINQTESQTKLDKQSKIAESTNLNKSKVNENQKNKIITDMLLQKINELENKVQSLEEEKKKNQEIIRSAAQYQSTPHLNPTYGSIKKNDMKKFSTVSQTQDTNAQYRVRSVSKYGSNNSEYKICSNIYSMTLMENQSQNKNIKEELNMLKKKLHALENAHKFNDSTIKQSIRENNLRMLENNSQADKNFSPNRRNLGGKIVKRSKLSNSPENSYRTETQQSLYEEHDKGFIRSGPKLIPQQSKQTTNSRYSNILQNEGIQNRKRVDSSAIFRKNPGPAIIQKNKFDFEPQMRSNNSIELNSDKQKIIYMDSKQTESLNRNDSSSPTYSGYSNDIFIPELIPFPTPQSSSQQLVQIGKLTFKKIGCQVTEGTILNVKKFKNCVLFSIGIQQNILWHYQGKFYYGGWRTFANGEGQKFGKGVQYAPTKYRYKGTFEDGKRSGFGIMIGENESVYIGQWSAGFKHGKGRLIQSDGTQYQGDWKHGKKSGNGKIISKGKIQFEGKFEGGYKNGFGKQYFENGDYYEGTYLNNKFDGKGSYLWASKALYTGLFKDGKRNGHGVWRSGEKNYDKYEGQYADDNKNGYGVYKWANGAIYEGSFKDDLKHGEGVITYQNGKSVSMVWNKGEIQKTLSKSQRFESVEKKIQTATMTPKTVLKKASGTRSSSNLQSAKSLKSDRSLPKGLSAKKEVTSQHKVQFRTKHHGSELIKMKMANDPHSFRNVISKQVIGGPIKDPPYKSLQTSSNVNMNI